MSILLNALNKNLDHKNISEKKIVLVKEKVNGFFIFFAMFLLGFLVYSGLSFYHDLSKPKVKPKPEPVVIAKTEKEILIDLINNDPDKFLIKLNVAPSTISKHREELMDYLIDNQLWRMAYKLSMSLPTVHKNEKELNMLSVNALEEADYLTAIANYNILIDKNPEKFEYYMGLAIAQTQVGEYKSAEHNFELALGYLDTNHPSYIYILQQLDILNRMNG